MFNYTCLNPIAGVGLDLFSDDYKKVDDLAGADAALVRSAAMHDLDLPDSLLAVARAGAGVNNIPLDKCADKDRKSTRLNSSHRLESRMPSSA